MPLRPTPETYVLVVVAGAAPVISLEQLRSAPVRSVADADHFVVLDAAGNPQRVPWSSILAALPAYIPPDPDTDEPWVLDTGEAWVTETGEAITF